MGGGGGGGGSNFLLKIELKTVKLVLSGHYVSEKDPFHLMQVKSIPESLQKEAFSNTFSLLYLATDCHNDRVIFLSILSQVSL